MSKLRLRITMSLDGFVAGPDQSVTDPLGKGGMQIHQWALALKAWRASMKLKGGVVNESTPAFDEATANVGATVMGRNMFGGHPGPWTGKKKTWDGWWGKNPPFHHPVFVLTHHAREPLKLEGGTTFTFVTEGIEAALARAKLAAGGKDIILGGGAKTAQQYLKAGLVDEMHLSIAPVLLGSGERLFENVGTDLRGMELVKTIAAPDVTHFKYARR